MKPHPFKSIGTGLILLGLLGLILWIRLQGVDRIPEGQFTGNDACLYYKQARTIDAGGSYVPRP